MMNCKNCNKEIEKEVFTFKGYVFCNKNCLNEFLKTIMPIEVISDLFCYECGNNKNLYRCKICDEIFCEICMENHQEEHLKIR